MDKILVGSFAGLPLYIDGDGNSDRDIRDKLTKKLMDADVLGDKRPNKDRFQLVSYSACCNADIKIKRAGDEEWSFCKGCGHECSTIEIVEF